MTSRILGIAVSIAVAAALAAGCGHTGGGRTGDSGYRTMDSPAPVSVLPSPSGPAAASGQAEATPPAETAGPPVRGPVGQRETPAANGTPAGADGERVAYLTFDDGPSGLTPAVLDILDREQVRATFFVTGSGLEKHGELVVRMAVEGHGLGNHTYSHDYARLYRSEDAFMEDVRRLDHALVQLTGRSTDVLRFPGGSNTRMGRKKGEAWLMPRLVKRVQQEGYQYFDWNVSSTDAAQAVQPAEEIVGAVMSAAAKKRSIIVLMHDAGGKTTTVEALPRVIRGLKELGFRFDILRKDSFSVHFLE